MSTVPTLGTLSAESRLALAVLSCIEEMDRHSRVVVPAWYHIYKRLETGDTPSLEPALAELAAAGLIEIVAEPEPEDGAPAAYLLEAGMAEKVRGGAEPRLKDAVDFVLAGYWVMISDRGITLEKSGHDGLPLITAAAVQAAPYLFRAGRYEDAAYLLRRLEGRNDSAATRAAIAPLLSRIADTAR